MSPLAPCGKKPNCVSSQDTRKEFYIAPLSYTGGAADALARLQSIIDSMPRTRLIEKSDQLLKYEFKSFLFGFTDDVIFYLDDNLKKIEVRSESRTGYSDLGVNRKRIEKIRTQLAGKDV